MLIASTANIIAYWSIEQDLLFLPFWPIKICKSPYYFIILYSRNLFAVREQQRGRW